MLYGFSSLHLLTYKDCAVITTAKQGSTYIRGISESVRGADNHVVTPTEKFGDDYLVVNDGESKTTKLGLKTLTELFSGKGKIKRILILYRNPFRKLTGGLYQDFTNIFPSADSEASHLLHLLLSNQLKTDISAVGLREVMSYLEGRRPQYKNPYNIEIEQIEEFVQDLFIQYCKHQLHSGGILEEGHTNPWCQDAITWSKEFEGMGYDVKFFNIDRKKYDLKETLIQTYDFPDSWDNHQHRGANNNVSKWFDLDKFTIPFNVSFRSVLKYEERGYDYLESDIRTITKP